MNSASKQQPNARTATLGVIGHPVGHSLSPLLHNTLLWRLRLDACYHAFDVEPAQLPRAVEGAAALGFLGLNVTVPHKQGVFRLCDELSDEARILKAVNTLFFRPDGTIFGANTDPYGFRRALTEFLPNLQAFTALVLGAGGAARSVLLALSELGATTVWIANRTLSRAQRLATELAPQLPGPITLRPIGLEPRELESALKSSSLVVNATSVGMSPNTNGTPLPEGVSLRPGTAVVDLIYNPFETRLLRQAREAGCKVENGLNMLIFQAVASLEIWFGRRLDFDADVFAELRDILVSALGKTLERSRPVSS